MAAGESSSSGGMVGGGRAKVFICAKLRGASLFWKLATFLTKYWWLPTADDNSDGGVVKAATQRTRRRWS